MRVILQGMLGQLHADPMIGVDVLVYFIEVRFAVFGSWVHSSTAC